MRSVYKALSHLGWERPGVFMNLQWEKIEEILQELGYQLFIDDRFPPAFKAVVDLKTDFTKDLATASGKSRQEAAMKVVIKLGEINDKRRNKCSQKEKLS